MVSVGPEGHYVHPPRDARPLASGRLLSVLALEVTPVWRAPTDQRGLRALIRRMSIENPLWGVPRIHDERLKLGFEVAQSSVAKYMVKRHGPPSQGWRTFLRNHRRTSPPYRSHAADRGIPVCTGRSPRLSLGHQRRLIWSATMTVLTAYLYVPGEGNGYSRPPILPGSPWQNGVAERSIGTVRRECLDRLLIFGESHLRRVLASYAAYYNQTRTHLVLQKDALLRRAVQRCGAIVAIPILAGDTIRPDMIFGKDRLTVAPAVPRER